MALFLILAPFATFATLMMLSTVTASLAAAAAVALGVVGWDQFKGRSAKMLSIGALVLFAAIGACHALTDSGMSPTAVRIAVDGGVLAIALTSLMIRLPFTLQYAREAVEPEILAQPRFLRTNYILTSVWTAAFVLMLLADIVAVYWPDLPLWACAAIAFAARNSAIYFTRWYPKRVRAAIAVGTGTVAA
jgi:hypothetical protein